MAAAGPPIAAEINDVVSAAVRVDGIARAFVVASKNDAVVAQALFTDASLARPSQ